MKLELFIAIKQILGKGNKRNMISFMGLISIVGVFIGVAVPIIVISIISGFQGESKKTILGVGSHITLYANYSHGMKDYRIITDKITKMEGVTAVVPYIELQGLLQLSGEQQPVIIRGVDYNFFTNDQTFFNTVKLTNGSWDISLKNRILIGSEVAARNYISINERLNIITAKNSKFYEIQPKIIKTMVVGQFKSGYYEYDNGIIFTSIETLQDALDLGDTATRISIKLDNIWHTEQFIERLMNEVPGTYNAYSWQQLNRNFFKALSLEKLMMWIVVFLILLVATFNIMGTQIMIVLEKRKDIGILKTLGMRPTHIYRIFLIQNMIITFTGAITGAITGMLGSIYITEVIFGVEWFLNIFTRIKYEIISLFSGTQGVYFPIILFPKNVYYLDHIPADVDINRAFIMIGVAILMSAIAGFLPSLLAARLRPITVIRYE